jgi:nucleoside-triphosphatase THEP1
MVRAQRRVFVMPITPCKLVLWTGPKHSGKTTAVRALAERAAVTGLQVAGLLSLSVYQQSLLVGYDLLDLVSGRILPVARLPDLATKSAGGVKAGRFVFFEDALRWGGATLNSAAARSAHLVIIDEFGPLELQNQGWRAPADALIHTSDSLVVLVVRDAMASLVGRLYPSIPTQMMRFYPPKLECAGHQTAGRFQGPSLGGRAHA